MPCVSVHGVPVAWSTVELPEDPLAMLGFFPPSDAAPRVSIELARAAPGEVPPPRGSPWFFHGVLSVTRDGDSVRMDDGASWAVVQRDAISARLVLEHGRLGPFAVGLIGAAVLLALRDVALFDLHAAALVDGRGRGILVAGDSGAGKTTTTLALLEAGAAHVGDDRVLLRRGQSSPDVLAWPREFHVSPRTLSFFPRLGALAGAPYGSGEKQVLDPERAYPGKRRLALPSVNALVFPRIDTNVTETHAVTVDRATAFGNLLVAGAMATLDGVTGGAEHLALLSALAGAGTPLELVLGRDVAGDPSVISRVIDDALGEAR
jgi:hypothetical protein